MTDDNARLPCRVIIARQFSESVKVIFGQRLKGEKVRLGDVCKIEFGTRVRRKDSAGGVYPVYGGGGATFTWPQYNRENCCIVSRFAMSQECVRFVRGKFFLNDSGLSVVSTDARLSQVFLDWCLMANTPVIYGLGRGTAQKNLDVVAFAVLSFRFPPLVEQRSIVARLDAARSRADRIKAAAERGMALAAELRKSILQEAFS